MTPKHRDIAPLLKKLRDFLLGRVHKTHHRFADQLSPKTPPTVSPPDSSALLSGNQYFTRDARREVKPAIDLMQTEQKQLASAQKAAEQPPAKDAPAPAPEQPSKDSDECKPKKSRNKPILGKVHMWD
ncbi:uncharacterized protein LOC108599337 [Drosophila busckii]|uniref:uncharacterized protein LOC108599337 n=1 Tax=Drosophila busckii TaxID=30019 RepID=UPI00083EAC24|nr:uncharacterized protein LOC108599337 [Drosophila busckii]